MRKPITARRPLKKMATSAQSLLATSLSHAHSLHVLRFLYYAMPTHQGRYWILTIPHQHFTPWLPPGVQYIRGQLERGEGGYLHWQVLVSYPKKVSLARIKTDFSDQCHGELSRSSAANEYVWKEDTRIANTQFEMGSLAFKRNSPDDWNAIWDAAKRGCLEGIVLTSSILHYLDIPADVRVRNYRTLKQIEKDHLRPIAIERQVFVFWGAPGTGKSRRAWDEAGLESYPKDPCTKFWDGYQSEENVVIDEFRGEINISHILRWFDRYPVNVECKFGATTLRAKKIWITSNVDPREWYPSVNEDTKQALLRRLTITHFPGELQPQ